MSLNDFLRNTANKCLKGHCSRNIDLRELKAYLHHFEEPQTKLERSFYQYKSQMFLLGKVWPIIMNIVSLPLLLYYLRPQKETAIRTESVEAIFIHDSHSDNILPEVLRNELPALVLNPEEGGLLLKEDRKYLAEVARKHPFSWQFLLKIAIKIRRYRYFIQRYQPKKMVVCNEYSFTSSAMTDYCERNGIELINVMHGEKLYGLENCFFQFHRCYVWDDHYANMFRKLRAYPEQFVVARPKVLIFETPKPETPEFDYTYYFQNEREEELMRIHAALLCLHDKGARISLRPHPRYSNIERLKALFVGMNIEDCKQVPIEQSILRTQNVISGFSTVLQQAYYNGINVVIDDISAPEIYSKMADWDYIMMSKEHKLLSKIIGA